MNKPARQDLPGVTQKKKKKKVRRTSLFLKKAQLKSSCGKWEVLNRNGKVDPALGRSWRAAASPPSAAERTASRGNGAPSAAGRTRPRESGTAPGPRAGLSPHSEIPLDRAGSAGAAGSTQPAPSEAPGQGDRGQPAEGARPRSCRESPGGSRGRSRRRRRPPPTTTTPLAPAAPSPRSAAPLAAPAASSSSIGRSRRLLLPHWPPGRPHAPSPLPAPTLRLSRSPAPPRPPGPPAAPHRVVGEQPGVVVQHEPAVLPALHHIGPFAQRALHDRRHLSTGPAPPRTPRAR